MRFDYCLDYLCKQAEEAKKKDDKPHPYREAAKVMGKSLAGLGLGYAAGAGAGKLLEHFVAKGGGNPADVAKKVAPLVGGAAGMVYPLWKSRERKATQDAVEREHNKSDGRVPGK